MNSIHDIDISDVIQGEKFMKLADNKTIYYRHTHDVNDFFKTIDFSHNFILISHNSDGKITDRPGKTAGGHLLSNGESPDADIKNIPNNLIRWYGQNVDYSSNLVVSIPIGLENSYNFPHLRKIQKLFSIKKLDRKIKNLVYLNFNVMNNPTERQPIYNMLKDETHVTVEYGRNGLNYDNYLLNLYNHNFMICPQGNGLGVHQPWESLYIGTIPIQKKTVNNQEWRELPFCWIDSWGQIKDVNFLMSEYKRISSLKFDVSKLRFSYWKKLILNNR